MARLQILELPTEHHGDDMITPFVLVIDQYEPRRYMLGSDQPAPVDEFEQAARQIGARAVIAFDETVEIPANEPPPMTVLTPEGADAERAGITEIVYAHERTRLDLCNALLVSGDTTWRKLIETVSKRQRELAGLYRKIDAKKAESESDLNCADVPDCDGQCCKPRSEVADERDAAQFYGAKLRHLGELLDEARQWARHGYEIGQRHCGWTDHGVAPAWLTDGWPHSFDSCEHLKQMAAFDEALTRVRNVPDEPEFMNAQQEHPGVWAHGYGCGVRAAKRAAAARPRDEKASGS